MSFFIWPREAALLGCALQEYLHSADWRACFFDTLSKRLSPFYPPIERIEVVEINLDDVPSDITWEITPCGLHRTGFAPSLPESWFLAFPERDLELAEHAATDDPKLSNIIDWLRRRPAFRTTRIDPTARNPLDIIAELVAPHAERSPADDARFNLTTKEAPWGLVQQRGWLHPNTKIGGGDDQDQIEAMISSLAFDDDPSDLGRARTTAFEAGRVVGGLLATCENAQRELFYLLYIADKNTKRFEGARAGWRATIGETLPILEESPLLDPDGNAATWLRYLAKNKYVPVLDPEKWDAGPWGGPEWQDDVADEIRKVSWPPQLVPLCVGHLDE